MTSGRIAGGPRPFVEHALVIDFNNMELGVASYGPLGAPRPFAKPNPEVDESRVRECVMSASALKFGIGSDPSIDLTYNQFTDLDPEDRLELLRAVEPRTTKWCEGILSSTAIEDLSEEEVDSLYTQVIENGRAEALEELPGGEGEDVIDTTATEVS